MVKEALVVERTDKKGWKVGFAALFTVADIQRGNLSIYQ